jgi:hypothetical protein
MRKKDLSTNTAKRVLDSSTVYTDSSPRPQTITLFLFGNSGVLTGATTCKQDSHPFIRMSRAGGATQEGSSGL